VLLSCLSCLGSRNLFAKTVTSQLTFIVRVISRINFETLIYNLIIFSKGQKLVKDYSIHILLVVSYRSRL